MEKNFKINSKSQLAVERKDECNEDLRNFSIQTTAFSFWEEAYSLSVLSSTSFSGSIFIYLILMLIIVLKGIISKSPIS